jgi:hypothetical protein
MNAKLIFLLMFFAVSASAQYNKDKLTSILTDDSQKTWNVAGINTNETEKTFTFLRSGAVITELKSNVKKTDKWSLMSSDNIRWFIVIAGKKYELIISYDKAGNQYIKLTQQDTSNKSSEYSEIRLTPVKP